jgi:hypothetical protein
MTHQTLKQTVAQIKTLSLSVGRLAAYATISGQYGAALTEAEKVEFLLQRSTHLATKQMQQQLFVVVARLKEWERECTTPSSFETRDARQYRAQDEIGRLESMLHSAMAPGLQTETGLLLLEQRNEGPAPKHVAPDSCPIRLRSLFEKHGYLGVWLLTNAEYQDVMAAGWVRGISPEGAGLAVRPAQ